MKTAALGNILNYDKLIILKVRKYKSFEIRFLAGHNQNMYCCKSFGNVFFVFLYVLDPHFIGVLHNLKLIMCFRKYLTFLQKSRDIDIYMLRISILYQW